MVLVATTRTTKYGLRSARCRVNRSASAARLRTIRGWDFDKRSSRPCELVAKHVGEAGPSNVADASPEVTADHPCDVQLFQHDDAVALGKSCSQNVQVIFALPSHRSVNTNNTTFSFVSILRSLPSSTDGSLCLSESFERCDEQFRVWNQFSVARSTEVYNPAIDGNDRLRSWNWIYGLDFADDTHKPLIAVSFEGARLWRSLQRAMHHRSKEPQFWETDMPINETPRLWMRFAERREVSSLSLPAWRSSELRKAALPSFVQLFEKLVADIPRDIIEPRQRRPQFGQLFHLIEGGRKPPFTARSCVAEFSLLLGEVPKKTQRAIPFFKSLDLGHCRVDAVAKSLIRSHASDPSRAKAEWKSITRWGFFPALKDGASAPKNR